VVSVSLEEAPPAEVQRVVETTLVDQSLTGNRLAIRKLVEYLAPTIRKKVLAILHSHMAASAFASDVDDVTQLVLEKMFRTGGQVLKNWDRQRPLRPYVAVIARNAAIDWLRERKNLDPLEVLEVEPSEDPRSDFESRDEMTRLMKELNASLSPQDSFLFRELIINDRSFEDISTETGMVVGTLHVRKHRLMKKVSAIAKKMRGAV
jgi:RNA polymerase sigma factor (sigma-70 family)